MPALQTCIGFFAGDGVGRLLIRSLPLHPSFARVKFALVPVFGRRQGRLRRGLRRLFLRIGSLLRPLEITHFAARISQLLDLGVSRQGRQADQQRN